MADINQLFVDPLDAIKFRGAAPTTLQLRRRDEASSIPLVCAKSSPTDLLIPSETTGAAALVFFDCTYGINKASLQSKITRRLANAFMAVSSFGNIIVNTFTSARGLYLSICNITGVTR